MPNTKKVLQKEVHTIEDADGNISINTKETVYQALSEPDYIKLYTRMWCDFYQIPDTYQRLFLELATRMSYCNSYDLDHSQIVYTGKPISSQIQAIMGWKANMYQKGLKALCDFGAIQKVNRGVYRINPNYAGKGAWKYNPKAEQGGVKDLVALFDFKNKTVEHHIVWADNGLDDSTNISFRDGLDVKKDDETILSYTTVKDSNDKSA